MPSIVTHAAVPLALRLGLGGKTISPRLLACGMIAAMLPDLDVIGLRLGVSYASEYGHRGFTHSLAVAALGALAGACFYRRMRTGFLCALLFLFATVASHGLLDTFTNGGRGVALLWPWSSERYFAP
jgi:inner membrane protein